MKKKKVDIWTKCAFFGLFVIATASISTFYPLGCARENVSLNSAESVALAFFAAIENKDAEAFVDCHDPDVIEENVATTPGMSEEDVIRFWDETFEVMQIEYSDLEFETQSVGENKIIVMAIKGHFRMGLPGITYEPDLDEAPISFEMVWKDGRWYIENEPLVDLNSDYVIVQDDSGDSLDE